MLRLIRDSGALPSFDPLPTLRLFHYSRQMTPDQTIDAATEVAAEEWVKFQVDMPANLNLRDQVTFFGSRVQKVLLTSFPDLRAANEQILLLIVARGIELSGSIPKPRIERELGIVLPPRPSLLSTRSGHSP